MFTKTRSVLVQILLVSLMVGSFGPAAVITAQQDVSLQQLREQIVKMEAVDSDSNTSSEVRALNKTLLADRRRQLAALLVKEIDGLKNYQQTFQQSLSAAEKQRIADLLGGLTQELASLKADAPSASQAARAEARNQSERTEGSQVANGNSAPAQVAGTITTNPPGVISNHLSRNADGGNGTSTFQAACYPDAPQALVTTARLAAQKALTDRKATSEFGDLTFFAITHTVAVDAGHDDLIESLQIKTLQEQTRRTDKQIGASANSAGSTSAAEKPGFAEILGFAIEHGGIQKAVNGTALSLSTTPYGLFTAFHGGDSESNYKEYGYLTRLGISADFNIDNQDNVLASVRRQQLTNWSLRFRATKDRSTRSDDAEEIWRGISGRFAQPSLVITQMLKDSFGSDVELEAKRREISDHFIALMADPSINTIQADNNLTSEQKIDQVAQKILCQLKTDVVDQLRSGAFKISQDSKDRIVRVTLPAYALALEAKAQALKDFDERIGELSQKPILTFAYDDVHPTMGGNYSQLKGLFSKGMGGPMSIVANGGFSLYHKPNHSLKQETVRDYSVALSLEGKAGRSPFLLQSKDESQITYSFTGRYERFLENRFIPGTKADIAVAQFKLTIPMFSGVSFPFSVTYANASELIKEDHTRANFGFSFDTDKLLKAITLGKLSTP